MTSDWPLVIDGREFRPIPATWIGWGYDSGRDDAPRVYAVSAAVVNREFLRIRYTHAQTPKVLVATCQAAQRPDGDGYVPAELASRQTWMRSTTPQGQDPDDVRRGPETAHLRELWHDHVDVIPAPAERAVADGGRAVRAVVDPLQGHLGRQGGEQR